MFLVKLKELVSGKTAGPFAGGAECAAIIAGATEEEALYMREFGMEFGIAFQLVDDILDLTGDERMGKPRGTDVHEGKMTLPIIHALTLLHGESRRTLSESWQNSMTIAGMNWRHCLSKEIHLDIVEF